MIYDYIYDHSLRSETNPSDHYRKNTIILLCTFSIFFKNEKLFKELTRKDVLSFLDSFRKIESVDHYTMDWNIQYIPNLFNEILQMAVLSPYRAGQKA